MNEFSRNIRNFFRIIKKPFVKKKDFWLDNIPEIDDENKKLINFIDEYSLTPLVRRWTLIKSIHYINKNKIEGDIVECGIWRGGNLFLAKKIQEKYYNDIKRRLYGYDTFEGMPQPSVYDGLKANKVYQEFKNKNEPWTKASLEDVLNSSSKLFSNSDDFIFIKGKVENTLIEKKKFT